MEILETTPVQETKIVWFLVKSGKEEYKVRAELSTGDWSCDCHNEVFNRKKRTQENECKHIKLCRESLD